MIKTYKLRTLDDKPVFMLHGKFLDVNFNIDTQETEIAFDVQ